MRTNFGELFQQKTKDKTMGGLVKVPADQSLWPPAWKNVEYKEYPLFEHIQLPQPIPKDLNQISFTDRQTLRSYSPNAPISLQSVSNLLYFSCGETTDTPSGQKRRIQPSGGGRYPIEVYLMNFQVGELDSYCYHYNVKEHSLEKMWKSYESKEDLSGYFTYPWCKDASFAIFITALPERSMRKYGERGLRYIYIEAGIVIGNLVQNARGEGFDSAVVAGTNDEKIEQALDIDGHIETLLMSAVFGKK